jgi:hypothetical protein
MFFNYFTFQPFDLSTFQLSLHFLKKSVKRQLFHGFRLYYYKVGKVICMENSVGQAQTVQVPNYSGVNIQIFNPSVASPGATLPASNVNAGNYSTNPSYPANYYTQNLAKPAEAAVPVQKRTEKREIVKITDDYIRNLENYLNNQNKEIRLKGAKEVLARLQEDDSRKDDPALNALVNKMLQDPYQSVRLMAFTVLNSRAATGNQTSEKILKNIQQQKTNYGEDAIVASEILLKMSGTTAQKEFDVTDKPQKTIIIREKSKQESKKA